MKYYYCNNKSSNILYYGATNPAEFLSVTSEYFFKRPHTLKKKHPKLYQSLCNIYQQVVGDIEDDIKVKR